MKQLWILCSLAVLFFGLYQAVGPGDIENGAVMILKPLVRWLAATKLTPFSTTPILNGTLQLPPHPCLSAKSSLEIYTDENGVPHVVGDNVSDVMFGQGLVTAQHRLFQLELHRRIATGTLSEVIGAKTLDMDRYSRVMGFGVVAEEDFQEWEASKTDDGRDPVECYTAGINAFIRDTSNPLPLEFVILYADPELNFRPKPFSVKEIYAVGRFLGDGLSIGSSMEPVTEFLRQIVGDDLLGDWTHLYNHTLWPTMIKDSGLGGSIDLIGGEQAATYPHFGGALGELGPGVGSNAWAVSGEFTKSGKPILAGDPHLPFGSPAIFMHYHLVTKVEKDTHGAARLNVTGVSLPGMPGIQIGHTEQFAWSITTSSHDASDLFAEKLEPCANQSSAQLCYLYKGDHRPLQYRREVIHIRGHEDFVEDVISTHHGPILPKSLFKILVKPVSVSSVSVKYKSAAILGFLEANLARNFQEFRAAIQSIGTGQLNVVYADADGNIGYQLVGAVPQRNGAHGMVPARGWLGEGEWTGWVPKEDMPYTYNPSCGFIISANNFPVNATTHRHFLGTTFRTAYRAKRIEDVITDSMRRGEKQDVHFHKELQNDVISIPGIIFARMVFDAEGTDADWRHPDVVTSLTLLKSWKPSIGSMDSSSQGAAVYRMTIRAAAIHLMEQHPGLAENEQLMWYLLGGKVSPARPNNEYNNYEIANVIDMLQDEGSWWVKKAGGRSQVLRHSLRRCTEHLRAMFGADTSKWRWGSMHKASFKHAFADVPVLGKVLSHEVEMGGDGDCVYQTGMSTKSLYHHENDAWSPAFQMVVDLDDVSRSQFTMPPGNSAHFDSAFYHGAIENYLRHDYNEMHFSEASYQKAENDHLLVHVDN